MSVPVAGKNSDLNGVILIDKPPGLTSHDVVARIRRAGKLPRVGHTGTLDPFATGVLPICIGRATRLAGLITLDDKEYLARLRLGQTTDTLDYTGQVLKERPVPDSMDAEQVEKVLEAFRGPLLQTPPCTPQ